MAMNRFCIVVDVVDGQFGEPVEDALANILIKYFDKWNISATFVAVERQPVEVVEDEG